MIGIIGYKMDKVKSITNAVDNLGKENTSVRSPEDFQSVNNWILPGDGNLDKGIENLYKWNFNEPILSYIQEIKPFFNTQLFFFINFCRKRT